jgi:MoxR-like ATPase
MDDAAGMTRDTLEALIDRMLDAETRTTPPPPSEARDWLYGSAGFTEADEHGWMAPLPSAHVWTPRALVFWRMAVRTGGTVSEEQKRDPRHSLARWPVIEAAVRRTFGTVGA